jgi:hypothetical protein
MSSNCYGFVFFGLRTTQDRDRIYSRMAEALKINRNDFEDDGEFEHAVLDGANKILKIYRCKILETGMHEPPPIISLVRFAKDSPGWDSPTKFDPGVVKKNWSKDISNAAKTINWPIRDRKIGWFVTSTYPI